MELINNTSKTNTFPDYYLDDIGLSVRPYNILRRSGYNKLSDLQGVTIEKLKGLRSMGKQSLEEVLNVLSRFNIKIGHESEDSK